jgi:hypothetical protein
MSKKSFYTIIALVALILLIVHDFNTLGVESIYIDPNFVSPHSLTTEIQRERLDILKNADFLRVTGLSMALLLKKEVLLLSFQETSSFVLLRGEKHLK